MIVFVRSDLYNAGLTDDGREYHAELFYVVIEFEDGSRLGHRHSFLGANRVAHEDGVFFEDYRVKAKSAADQLRSQVYQTLKQKAFLESTNNSGKM